MSDEEILSLGAQIRGYHLTGRMGPLAVIMGSGQSEAFARLLGALAAADRPMRYLPERERCAPLARKTVALICRCAGRSTQRIGGSTSWRKAT